MWRASFLLFSLLLTSKSTRSFLRFEAVTLISFIVLPLFTSQTDVASAIEGDDSIFSRDMLFYGGRNGGNTERTCTRKVGDGFCADINGSYYSTCYVVNVGSSLEDCQEIGINTANVIGVEFSAGSWRCDLVYNGLDLDCPEGFSEADGNNGVGPIVRVVANSNVVCYAC